MNFGGFLRPQRSNCFLNLTTLFMILCVLHLTEPLVPCIKDAFHCRSGECVKPAQRCDSNYDCPDGSDEDDCDAIACRDKWFTCRNKRCVTELWVCDGENDCGDNSDEQNCGGLGDKVENCTDEEFRCVDGSQCILATWFCDGEHDCHDASDEPEGCLKLETEPCTSFLCENKECIPEKWRCDGGKDCRDGSDEENCDHLTGSDSEKGHSRCNKHGLDFACADGSKCIPRNWVCDDKDHCPDGSDEGGNCKNTTCPEAGCQHSCFQTPINATCACPDGYELGIDQKSCQDIDECNNGTIICSQICQNTPGAYRCKCEVGYFAKGRTCLASGPEPFLLFVTKTDIRILYLHNVKYYSIHSAMNRIVGVAYDSIDDRVFWSDIGNAAEVIMSSKMDGSDPAIIIGTGLQMPEDLAVDWVGRNLYFTDSGAKHIAVCSLLTSHCTVLLQKDLDNPRALLLIPSRGEMLWTDWGETPHIGKAGMDGSNQKYFLTNDLQWPNGLALDPVTNRLYWSDARSKRIESINIDGTNRKIILDNVYHPFSLAVFENTLYWTDWTRSSLESCDKTTGKNHQTLVKETGLDPMGIHVYHPLLQKSETNQCWGTHCSHMCLIAPEKGYACACPVGFRLDNDQKTCIEKKNETWLIASIENDLVKVHPKSIGQGIEVPVASLHHTSAIIAMVYDEATRTIIASDGNLKQIVAIKLSDSSRRIIVDKHLDVVEGLALDWIGRTLYWTDAGREIVEMAKLDGSDRREIMTTEGSHPMDIEMVPTDGLMFIALISNNPTIERFNMDGTNRRVLVSSRLASPLGLAADVTKKRLYWADAGTGTIEFVNFQGRQRNVLKSEVGRPLSLAVFGQRLYWSDLSHSDIFWGSKFNQQSRYRAALNLAKRREIRTAVQIVIVTEGKQTGSNECSVKKSCSHFCIPTSTNYSCACPTGMILSTDGAKCIAPATCSITEFTCGNGACIPQRYRCDGSKDCSDNSDEQDCEPKQCKPEEFRCDTGLCILSTWKCDLHRDCPNGDDEKNCFTECQEHEFACSNRCIFQTWRCDGEKDCPRGEDEENCNANKCSDGEFRCGSGQCITEHWVCDGDNDCAGGEDEHENCTYKKCNNEEYTCNNTRCISKNLVCDRNDDCADGSDEIGCAYPTCPTAMFTCISDGKCILQKNLCDGIPHCSQGEDEENCERKCMKDEFDCKTGHCIPKEWLCDGQSDCENNSDEIPPACAAQTTRMAQITGTEPTPKSFELCKQSEFACTSGECISLSLACNKQPDCKDMSDEGSECVFACINHNGGCSDRCIATPNGPRCNCSEGLIMMDDQKTCSDIDECVYDNKCSHFCTNFHGGFKCSCAEGYALHAEESCKAVGPPAALILAYHSRILSYTIDGHHLNILLNKGNRAEIRAVDVHVASGAVYWAEGGNKSINRLDIQSGVSETYIANIPASSVQMAVDWISDNLYYWDTTGYIYICTLKTTNACTKLIPVSRIVSSIVVYPHKRLLIWCTWTTDDDHKEGRIYSSWLNGENIKTMVFEKLMWPTGLAVDFVHERIFWSDAWLGKIETADTDGLDRHTVYSSAKIPMDIALFEDFIYWADWGTHTLYKCEKFGCKKPEILHHENVKIFGMVLFHQIQQPRTINPCSHARCSHICVVTQNSFACLCPTGYWFADYSTTDCINPDLEMTTPPATTLTNTPAVPDMAKPSNKQIYIKSLCRLKCANGGECEYVNETYICRCPEDYSGELCEKLLAAPSQSTGPVVTAVIITLIVLTIFILAVLYYIKRVRAEPSLASAWRSFRKFKKSGGHFTAVSFANPVFRYTTTTDDDDTNPMMEAEVQSYFGDGPYEADVNGNMKYASQVNLYGSGTDVDDPYTMENPSTRLLSNSTEKLTKSKLRL